VRIRAWEGAETRRSASQETHPAVDSTQPFEHKGGSLWRGLFVLVVPGGVYFLCLH
jgi:hypothetical protein